MKVKLTEQQFRRVILREQDEDSQYYDIDVTEENKKKKLGKYFTYEDLYSKGNNKLYIFKKSLSALDKVIDKWPYTDYPIRLTNQVKSSKNGAYRDPEWNDQNSGSGTTGPHTKGWAFDLDVSDMPKDIRLELLKYLDQAKFTGFGHGAGVIHADMGRKRYWSYSGYEKPDEKEYRGVSPEGII